MSFEIHKFLIYHFEFSVSKFVFKTKIAIYNQLRKEDAGNWKPDADKGECGEDLKTQFIVCDDKDGCAATRNEFPYMVCRFAQQLKNHYCIYLKGIKLHDCYASSKFI